MLCKRLDKATCRESVFRPIGQFMKRSAEKCQNCEFAGFLKVELKASWYALKSDQFSRVLSWFESCIHALLFS